MKLCVIEANREKIYSEIKLPDYAGGITREWIEQAHVKEELAFQERLKELERYHQAYITFINKQEAILGPDGYTREAQEYDEQRVSECRKSLEELKRNHEFCMICISNALEGLESVERALEENHDSQDLKKEEGSAWDRVRAITDELVLIIRKEPWVVDTDAWKAYADVRGALNPLAHKLTPTEEYDVATTAKAVKQLVARCKLLGGYYIQ